MYQMKGMFLLLFLCIFSLSSFSVDLMMSPPKSPGQSFSSGLLFKLGNMPWRHPRLKGRYSDVGMLPENLYYAAFEVCTHHAQGFYSDKQAFWLLDKLLLTSLETTTPLDADNFDITELLSDTQSQPSSTPPWLSNVELTGTKRKAAEDVKSIVVNPVPFMPLEEVSWLPVEVCPDRTTRVLIRHLVFPFATPVSADEYPEQSYFVVADLFSCCQGLFLFLNKLYLFFFTSFFLNLLTPLVSNACIIIEWLGGDSVGVFEKFACQSCWILVLLLNENEDLNMALKDNVLEHVKASSSDSHFIHLVQSTCFQGGEYDVCFFNGSVATNYCFHFNFLFSFSLAMWFA